MRNRKSISKGHREKITARLRKARGDVTQAKFSQQLRTSQQNLSRYENGTMPSVEGLIAYASLGTSVDWLLFGRSKQAI